MPKQRIVHLEAFRPPVALKLSALWASLMFCYIYGDYFGLYEPGKLAEMADGRMAFGVLTPLSLVIVSAMMAVPAVMVAFSLLLSAPVSRMINLILGAAYAGIMLLTMTKSPPPYYLFLGVVEVLLSGAIIAYAWSWPRVAGMSGDVSR